MALFFQILIDLTSLTYIGVAYWTFNEKCSVYSDSFGILGLKRFIISDDSRSINKDLFALEKFKHFDDKITVVETNFSRTA